MGRKETWGDCHSLPPDAGMAAGEAVRAALSSCDLRRTCWKANTALLEASGKGGVDLDSGIGSILGRPHLPSIKCPVASRIHPS